MNSLVYFRKWGWLILLVTPFILKPIWFLASQKTKSWLQLSPDWKSPRTLLGQNSFWIIAKNYFEMSIFQSL